MPKPEYNLAVLYFNGDDVAEDRDAAARLYRRAAEKGHIETQNNLAGMYALGLGLAQDLVLVYMWATLAVDEDAEFAEANRTRLAALMTPKQIAAAEQLAENWEPTD